MNVDSFAVQIPCMQADLYIISNNAFSAMTLDAFFIFHIFKYFCLSDKKVM